ncbi:hypothetical protein AALP_AAs68319U000400 [Arabis alpina]|uniref:Uncharacterized protein n=1 Tax=Arabis alpina TaxID=50452 RepID=A0A087G2N6_ARAAL|nr:hypothetical protein AALP_AAs68319U000400 [Arabis alpina]
MKGVLRTLIAFCDHSKYDLTPEAEGKCIARLLLYHFCVNLPLMMASYPDFKFMGMQSMVSSQIVFYFIWLLDSTNLMPKLSTTNISLGMQSVVAFVNLGSYYAIGVPLGLILMFSILQKEFVPIEIKVGSIYILSLNSRHAYSLHVLESDGCKWVGDD